MELSVQLSVTVPRPAVPVRWLGALTVFAVTVMATLAEPVDGLQPPGAALLSPQFPLAFFLPFAFGPGAKGPRAADDPARWVTQLLADLSNPFARKAIFSGQDYVHGGRKFAFQILAGRHGKFSGNTQAALAPQHAALPQELYDVVYG